MLKILKRLASAIRIPAFEEVAALQIIFIGCRINCLWILPVVFAYRMLA